METTPYQRNATHVLPVQAPLTDSRLGRIRRMTLVAISLLLDAEGFDTTESIQPNETASGALHALIGMLEESGDVVFTGDTNSPDPIFGGDDVRGQLTHISEILPHSDRDLAFAFALRALSESDPVKADDEAREAIRWASRAAVNPPPRRCGYPECRSAGTESTKSGDLYCAEHFDRAQRAEKLGG